MANFVGFCKGSSNQPKKNFKPVKQESSKKSEQW
jgi:hypothetical protein